MMLSPPVARLSTRTSSVIVDTQDRLGQVEVTLGQRLKQRRRSNLRIGRGRLPTVGFLIQSLELLEQPKRLLHVVHGANVPVGLGLDLGFRWRYDARPVDGVFEWLLENDEPL